MDNELWHSRNIDDILIQLNTSTAGLTNEEAEKRLARDGANKLPKAKKAGVVKIFFSQFLNPIIYILLVVVILSFITAEMTDAIFVLLVILVDAFMGAFQEWKAGKESESLQSLIRVNARVLRNKKEKSIDSEKLVVGDIVMLESGDKVSADLRLINVQNLSIDESILTGESITSNKISNIMPSSTLISDRDNMAYAGTSVATGRGIGVVVAVATNTEIGKIANKVISTDGAQSPLVVRMEKFTNQISRYMIFIAIFLTIILYLKDYKLESIFSAVIGLSVSAIPEGLPLALTLALSIASNRMAKKNVVVKKLNAVESLGSCTVIASDKTGTLTVNEQTAKRIILPDGRAYTVEGSGYNGNGRVSSLAGGSDFTDVTDLAIMGAINNEASLTVKNGEWKSLGDSIDIAFLALAYKLDLKENIKKAIDIVGIIPYESEKKYSAVFYEDDEDIYCTAKGATEKNF